MRECQAVSGVHLINTLNMQIKELSDGMEMPYAMIACKPRRCIKLLIFGIAKNQQ